MKRGILTLIIIILVVILGVMLFGGKNNGEDTDEATMEDDEMVTIEESEAVVLADQKPGSTATVSYAKLSSPGYVYLYTTVTETDTNGKVVTKKKRRGGSRRLPAGEYTNLEITLDDPTEDGDVLEAVLHEDDGDGQFNEEDDIALDVSSEAEISEDAVELADLDLEDLLEEAGYTLVGNVDDTDESMVEDDPSTEEDLMEDPVAEEPAV